jgi:hypothetical protein
MHIDWFIVLVVIVGSALSGYALWLSGKGDDEKRRADRDKAENPTSH